MTPAMSSITRPISIQCEGNRGEVLKVTTKPSSWSPAGSTTSDTPEQSDGNTHILPPVSGLIILTLQVRVDRKLLPTEKVRTSGLLKAIVSFLNTYGAKLRIKTVLEAEHDQGNLEIPLLMQPFPSPLSQNIGSTVTRLETLAFALHFYTPSSDEYTCKLREALLSANMGAPLSSLIFRAMLKCFSKIVIKYPLVFDARWLEYLQDQSVFLPSIAKSLKRLTSKMGSENQTNVLQQCLKRLNNCSSTDESFETANSLDNFGTQASDVSQMALNMPQLEPLEPLRSSFFALLMHATKRKHAITKLVPHSRETELPSDAGDIERATGVESHHVMACADSQTSNFIHTNTAPTDLDLHACLLEDGLHVVESASDPEYADHTWTSPVLNVFEPLLPDPPLLQLPEDLLYSNPAGQPITPQLNSQVASEEIDWPEIECLEECQNSMTVEDIEYTISQLADMTGPQKTRPRYYMDGEASQTAYWDNFFLTGADMLIDGRDFSEDVIFTALDEHYLDEIDAKMADLAEEVELNSLDRTMMALLQV